MSVRIYQLSKDIGLSNKEVLELLAERGYEVKSASSTISNIDADAIKKEYSENKTETAAEAETVTAANAKAPKAPGVKTPAAAPKPPTSFVKSATDLVAEKKAKETTAAPKPAAPAAAAKPAGAPTPPTAPPPAPLAGAAPAAPTPPSAPASPGAPSAPAVPAAPSAEGTGGEGETQATGEAGELKLLKLRPPIVVREFAEAIGVKPFKLISELMERGIFASMNQSIEEAVAKELAGKYGFEIELKLKGEAAREAHKAAIQKDEDAVEVDTNLVPRPPVVCVLGHVDHGKTTVLDTIRKANVVKGEAGGITQHVGAYQVEQGGKKLTFLDTPGHAAFSKMRERGADVTDIAVLVVAADDGFMPQTDEALKFAQKAGVPVVVAINKMDAPGANPDNIKKELQERNIASEDWGGDTLTSEISALKGTNIDNLLENILLQAEILELKANPDIPPAGVIIESQIERGRGATATVIVQQGTLKPGVALHCGATYCKVRALMDENGKPMKKAPPSTPVRVTGWESAPESGAAFTTVKNDREARSLAEAEAHRRKQLAAGIDVDAPVEVETNNRGNKGGYQPRKPRMDNDTAMDALFAAIENTQKKCLRIVLKADVNGTLEALQACLEGIESEKVNLEVIQAGVGAISQNDIARAATGGALVVGFNVGEENGVRALCKRDKVTVIAHDIIYELIDQVKEAMAELLDPELREQHMGFAEVRALFGLGKSGTVAGCMVTDGYVKRDGHARLLRGKQGKEEVIYEGKVSTLKRFKDDATEVRSGFECGIRLGNFNDYQEGDRIETFEIKKIQPKL